MKEQKRVFNSGNEMAAYAAAHINYHVMGYYPISPSTEIAQNLDMMRVNGVHDIHMIPADGEHPSAGICYGAAVAGARVFNATSSNGLAYMLEQLPVVSGTRYPMVMNLVNRTVSAPLNIHCDHSDLYMTLNIGWLIVNASNPQAVYDQNIIALKVAEHKDVMLPAIVSYDGYITSHQKHNVNIFADTADVRNFVGEKRMDQDKYLNLENPVTVGAHMASDHFIDNRVQMNDALNNALAVYEDVANEYAELTGRRYDVIEKYQTEDADTILFCVNSAAEIAKEAVDKLRAEGKKVGLIKPNILRPFPAEAIKDAIKDAKNLLIAERADNPGSNSSYLSGDINQIIHSNELNVKSQTMIYGLGGKEIFADDFVSILDNTNTNGVGEDKFYFGQTETKNEEKTLIHRNVEYNSEDYKVGGFKYDFDEETQKLNVRTPILRNLMKKPKRITGGHSACPGCGIFPGVELFLRGIEGDVIMINQTGCAYVVTANYPYSAHKGNYIHNLFQNGAATLSGAVDAVMELKDRGEIEFADDATFVMLSGDGGMDIGMGTAIGAALRNHKMIILEYDNEGYMNTGAQQSYSTPIGHRTSTSNVGSKIVGKEFDHKDTVQIMAATNIPYVFTGVDAFPQDLIKKAAKAQWYANNHGLVYGKILITCPLNWKSDEKDGSNILEAAVNCNFFPLYEIENGRTNLTYNPEEIGAKVEAEEWLKYMGKSKHLLKPENKEILEHFKSIIDLRYRRLMAKHEHPEL